MTGETGNPNTSGNPGTPDDSGEQHVSPFDAIRHLEEDGEEYWSARELAKILTYANWQNFAKVIERAGDICSLLRQDVSRHFAVGSKSILAGKGAERDIPEYRLSRLATYLILLCSDANKPGVIQALAHVAHALLDMETDPAIMKRSAPIPDLDAIAITKEQKTIGQIVRAFRHVRSVRHYRVAPYYVDLYFPAHRIVVECDENGHSHPIQYAPQAESARQTFIERTLACQFVRYNPDAPEFNIGDVINRIMRLVYRSGEQPTESEAS